MRKTLCYPLLVIVGILFSGCFTVGTQLKLNDDMSGSVTIAVAPDPSGPLRPEEVEPQLSGPKYTRRYKEWAARPAVVETVDFDNLNEVTIADTEIRVQPGADRSSGKVLQTISMNVKDIESVDQLNMMRLALAGERYHAWIDPPGQIVKASSTKVGTTTIYPEVKDEAAHYNFPLDQVVAAAWANRPVEMIVEYRLPIGTGDTLARRPLSPGSDAGTVAVANDFPLPPLIAGNWQTVSAGAESRLRAKVRGELPVRYRDAFDAISAFRSLELPFYEGATLYEGNVASNGGPDGLFTIVDHPKGMAVLDGGSDVIHRMNSELALWLDTQEQAETYLRFFNASIQGDEGTFVIVDNVRDLQWLEGASTADVLDVAGKITSPELQRTNEGWQASSSVAYSNALFAASFSIGSNGMVAMLDDDPIAADLPISTYRFRDGVRSVASGAREASQPQASVESSD